MTDVTRCPVEGCGYEANKPSSVLAHCQGKSTDGHRGISYMMARSALENGRVLEQGAEHTDDSAALDDAGRGDGGGSAGIEPPEPQAEPRPDERASSRNCPDCGSARYHDADEFRARNADVLSPEDIRALRSHDRVCSDCMEVYDE